MEIALWTLSKKLEIGFELDLWPNQLVSYVLFWMHSLTNHMNSNRVAYMAPFIPHDQKGDVLVLNKLYYSQKNERTRGLVFTSYVDYGRLALIKANLVILWMLDQAGALKRFMNERELELAYDAKVYLPFSEFFFIKRQRYHDAKKEMQQQIEALGASVSSADQNAEILMKVKAELFEASKDVNVAAKEVIEPEHEKTELANLAKVSGGNPGACQPVAGGHEAGRQEGRAEGDEVRGRVLEGIQSADSETAELITPFDDPSSRPPCRSASRAAACLPPSRLPSS